MKRISSRLTHFQKRVAPAIAFTIISLIAITGVLTGTAIQEPFFLVILAGVSVFLFFLMKKLTFDLLDEAFSDGEYILVRNHGQEDRIALSSIESVSYQHLINPPRVTLSLKQPSRFGNEITFMAPVQLRPFKRSPEILELIENVYSSQKGQKPKASSL